jgi:hypothetical protein
MEGCIAPPRGRADLVSRGVTAQFIQGPQDEPPLRGHPSTAGACRGGRFNHQVSHDPASWLIANFLQQA